MVNFSGSGRAGRTVLPSIRWKKRKKTATPRKTSKYRVKSVINAFGSCSSSLASRALAELLSPGKPGVHFVPVSYLRFPETPAEINFAAVQPAREVQKPGEIIFQFDAEVFQFSGILAETVLVALKLSLGLLQFLGVRLQDHGTVRHPDT